MIDRSEILEVATDLSLAPEIVEKDYVLGWLLAGIYRDEELIGAWTFNGVSSSRPPSGGLSVKSTRSLMTHSRLAASRTATSLKATELRL